MVVCRDFEPVGVNVGNISSRTSIQEVSRASTAVVFDMFLLLQRI